MLNEDLPGHFEFLDYSDYHLALFFLFQSLIESAANDNEANEKTVEM